MQQQNEHHISHKSDHISVCICTYKRPKLLERLLSELQSQVTNGLFTYSIVVVDNDYTQSAKKTVEAFKTKSLTGIDYYNEPEQNIALARNKAVQNAKGNFVAFIDDDEFPDVRWLLNLYKTCNEYNTDGVLGPVKPHFETEAPQWILKGKICERKSHETGTILTNYSDTRTGNVLLIKKLFNDEKNLFDPNFGRTGGEDAVFFRRMIQNGKIFVWCNEAPVYETVSPERLKKLYHLKRALLHGRIFQKIHSKEQSLNKHLSIIKSLFASIIYSSALPILFLSDEHIFVKYLIKNLHHIGKLAAIAGIMIIKHRIETVGGGV